MPNIQHSALTGSELHEPKGADTASDGDVYVADGAGSGAWEHPAAHASGYVSFDSATPAYAFSASTSDQVINPTFVAGSLQEFTADTSPNARFTYTGTDSRDAFLMFNASLQQSSGATRDVELVFYKNGSALEGSRVIRSASTATWGSVSMHYDLVLATNDYIEVFAKVDSGTPTINFAQMYLGILAVTN